MKKWLYLLCVLALPCIADAWAFSCPSDGCFHASIGGEALYWRPYTDDYLFGQYGSGSERSLLDLEADFDWGFRVFAQVTDPCECNFIDVEWARVKNSADTFEGPRPPATLFQFPFASANPVAVEALEAAQESRYQKFSAKLGHRFFDCNGRYFYGYLGGRWAYINLKRTSLGFNPSGSVDQRTSFNGGGAEVGVGGQTHLWCGFGTGFRFGGVGLFGNTAFSSESNFASTSVKMIEEKHQRWIGGLELRAELNYTYCFKCVWIRGEVGYELDYYSNPLLFPPPLSNVSVVNRSDFGIGGLFFGVTAGF